MSGNNLRNMSLTMKERREVLLFHETLLRQNSKQTFSATARAFSRFHFPVTASQLRDIFRNRHNIRQAPLDARRITRQPSSLVHTEQASVPPLISSAAFQQTPPVPRPHLLVPNKSSDGWKLANSVLANKLTQSNIHISPMNFSYSVDLFTDLIYSTLSQVWTTKDSPYQPKKTPPTHPLLPAINDIKSRLAHLRTRIRSVSECNPQVTRRLLKKRSRLNRALQKITKRSNEETARINEDQATKKFKKNPWKYASEVFNPTESLDRTDLDDPAFKSFWANTLVDSDREKPYATDPCLPEVPFRMPRNMISPIEQRPHFSERQILKFLARRKKRSSPGLDGIPVQVYGLPCLVPYVTTIMNCAADMSTILPASWTTALIVFIPKKQSPLSPSDYRPIALTSTLGKVFTGLLAQLALSHMSALGLWSPGQKGFLSKVSGCLENHLRLEHIIHSTSVNRSSFIVSTDIANAFGSIRHSMIQYALERYRLPLWFRTRIVALYSQLKWIIGNSLFDQQIGVFQGDPLSPVLFSIGMNVILEFLDDPSVASSVGVMVKGTYVDHCSYADDVILIGRSQSGTQRLLDLFSTALRWSETLKGKGSKFRCVEYFKGKTPQIVPENSECATIQSERILTRDPNLQFNGLSIPLLGEEDDADFNYTNPSSLGPALPNRRCHPFKLLGKWFPTAPGLSLRKIEMKVELTVSRLLNRLDEDQLPDNLKLEVFKLAFAAYVRWDLQVNSLRESFISNTVNSACIKRLRKWAGLSQGDNWSILVLPPNMLGAGLPDSRLVWKSSELQRVDILRSSNDTLTRDLANSPPLNSFAGNWNPFSEHDRLSRLLDSQSALLASRRKLLVRKASDEHFSCVKFSLDECESQGKLSRSLPADTKIFWLSHLGNLPLQAVRFGLRSIINTCPTAVTRSLWFTSKVSPICKRCSSTDRQIPQTLGHVLAHCDITLGIDAHSPQNRITYRHNRILACIVRMLKPHLSSGTSLFGDLDGLRKLPTSYMDSYSSLVPDLVVVSDTTIVIAELTSPMEHNMNSWHEKKSTKYEGLRQNIAAMNPGKSVEVKAFEVGARGGVSNSLREFLVAVACSRKVINKICAAASSQAVQASELIFKFRDSSSWIV